MIHIRTPSRLHFGLLSLAGATADRWANYLGEPAVPVRRFGGVGLMVDAPGLELTAQLAPTWSASGALAERTLRFARQFLTSLPTAPPLRFIVTHAPTEHIGLGVGTQLGMAVARAIAVAAGKCEPHCEELACHVGRGNRSALGIHGFARGGFLVDGGKGPVDTIAPLLARVEFPQNWLVLLIMLAATRGLHGPEESQAFEHLAEHAENVTLTDTLCRLVLLGMLPALAARDLNVFGEALYDFNARVGSAFASLQGGVYAHERAGEIVTFLRRQGIRGVGQSSWGPTLFAIIDDADRAEDLRCRLQTQFSLADDELLITTANNQGAMIAKGD